MATTTANGRIAQVIGSTFDADFDEAHLPDIYNALKVETEEKGVKIDLTGEVQQHLGGNRVRCVALGSTDGLVRPQVTLDYMQRLCHVGSRVRMLVMPDVNHGFAGRDSAGAAVGWIADRFAQRPPPSDCQE